MQQQRPREGRARSWQLTWASFAAALLLSPTPAAYAEQPLASAPAAMARATGTAAPTAARLHVVGAARAGSPTTIRAALPARPRVRSYRWHFDDTRRDVTGAGTPTLVRHTFRTSGRHEVRLTLTSDHGRQTRVTLRLRVAGAGRPAGAAPAPTAPMAPMAPMAPGTPPTTTSGSTRSTRLTVMGRGDRAERDGWSARDENTVFRFGGDTRGADADRWAIDYGDGNTATGLGALPPTLTHTYLSSGAPTVIARLTSSDGTTVAASTTLEVTDAELVELSCPRTAVVGQPVRWTSTRSPSTTSRPCRSAGPSPGAMAPRPPPTRTRRRASTNRCRTPTTRSAGTCWKRRSWTTTVDCSSSTR